MRTGQVWSRHVLLYVYTLGYMQVSFIGYYTLIPWYTCRYVIYYYPFIPWLHAGSRHILLNAYTLAYMQVCKHADLTRWVHSNTETR